MDARRVVITGMGVVSPLGCNLDLFWERLTSGHSGIGPITRFDSTEYAVHFAGEVADFDIDRYVSKKEQRRTDAFENFGLAAAMMAKEDAGLELDKEDLERIGVLVGSGIGGLDILEKTSIVIKERGPKRVSPFCIPQLITNILAGRIAIEYRLQGPNFCITSACATATHSIGEALRIIQQGEADVIFAGGSEGSVTPLGIGGFCAMRALSTRNDDPLTASRPFDKDRDGFVCAEGAGVVVMETLEHAKARGARIYCEVAGYGRTCDAFHITAPDEEGRGAARAMRLAVEDAGLNADHIDYINAHGTSTPLNDKCETMAIKKALGEDVARKLAVSSTKSMTGHLLGAAGGVETIACALSIQNGAIAPTINYTTPDPDCDLDYTPNEAREYRVDACLNNSLGFGGHNATLCFKRV